MKQSVIILNDPLEYEILRYFSKNMHDKYSIVSLIGKYDVKWSCFLFDLIHIMTCRMGNT